MTPIKEIFVTENDIIIDPKTREEYSSELSSDSSFLQDWLSMPLSTSQEDLLNLPNKITGTSQRIPYISIYGAYKSDKSKETIELRMRGKTKEKKYVELISRLNLSTLDEEFPDREPKIFARLDMKNYMIGDSMTYDAYTETLDNQKEKENKLKELEGKYEYEMKSMREEMENKFNQILDFRD